MTASANDWWEIPFHSNTSRAQLNQIPLQSSGQVPSLAFSKISSWDNLLLWSLLLDSAISQPVHVLSTSATAFSPLLRINSAKSVFACFCSFAKASSSVRVLIPLSETSKTLKRERLRFLSAQLELPSSPESPPLFSLSLPGSRTCVRLTKVWLAVNVRGVLRLFDLGDLTTRHNCHPLLSHIPRQNNNCSVC